MKQELKDSLLEYLGEVMYDIENSPDYFDKSKLKNKSEAIHALLDLPYKEQGFSIYNFAESYKNTLNKIKNGENLDNLNLVQPI